MEVERKQFNIGRKFFTISERIGKGAFGEVFKAKRDGKEVAVKIEDRNANNKYLQIEIKVLLCVHYH